jgi:hypothetical protein
LSIRGGAGFCYVVVVYVTDGPGLAVSVVVADLGSALHHIFGGASLKFDGDLACFDPRFPLHRLEVIDLGSDAVGDD